MSALESSFKTTQRWDAETPPAYTQLLNFLRLTALACRAKPRVDLFKACALLHVSRSRSREADADALMRCLNDATGKRLTFHSPGTAEVSFDEAWIMQLATALVQNDQASATFLLRSRVTPDQRRLIGFLVGRIAVSFYEV